VGDARADAPEAEVHSATGGEAAEPRVFTDTDPLGVNRHLGKVACGRVREPIAGERLAIVPKKPGLHEVPEPRLHVRLPRLGKNIRQTRLLVLADRVEGCLNHPRRRGLEILVRRIDRALDDGG
jgi:hypothetical protein